MFRTVPVTIVLIVSLVLGGAVVVQRHQLSVAREQSVALALAAENAVAERDSTRTISTLNRTVAKLLGDSLALVEKRVVQVAQARDALDDALGRERRAAFVMNVVIDSLRQSMATVATVNDSGDVRRARFDVRQVPYHVTAEVVVPQPPDSARMSVQVVLDTIRVGARLTCAAPNAQGIRVASIVASTPTWATVRFGQVEQAPEVCQTQEAQRGAGHRLVFRPLSLGVGRAAVWGGASGWALFVGAVISIG